MPFSSSLSMLSSPSSPSIARVCLLLSQVLAHVRGGKTLRFGCGIAESGDVRSTDGMEVFVNKNPTTRAPVPKIEWSHTIQDEMDAILISVLDNIAESSKEVRALLGILVAAVWNSGGENSHGVDNSSGSDQKEPGDESAAALASDSSGAAASASASESASALESASASASTKLPAYFATAREWLSTRLCRQLELIALEIVDGETSTDRAMSSMSPFSTMFFLLEAIRDVGPVPGVIERLGALAGKPNVDTHCSDSEADSGSGGEVEEEGAAEACELGNSPLLSLALSEVIRSLLTAENSFQ